MKEYTVLTKKKTILNNFLFVCMLRLCKKFIRNDSLALERLVQFWCDRQLKDRQKYFGTELKAELKYEQCPKYLFMLFK